MTRVRRRIVPTLVEVILLLTGGLTSGLTLVIHVDN